MKRAIYFTLGALFLTASCSKIPDKHSGSIIVTGIKTSKGADLVSIQPDSGIISTTHINGYVFGSTVFDTKTNSYGFVNSDSVFVLIDPITGAVNKSIKLPGFLSLAVIDENDHTLIGRYTTIEYSEDPDTIDTKSAKAGPPVYSDYVLRVDLESGLILSENQFDAGDGIYACSYFYDPVEKAYYLLRADNYLISVNPATGEINKSVNLGTTLNNIVYNKEDNTIIGLTYSPGSNKIHLEVYDLKTCSQVSDVELDQLESYLACISGFDRELNCYILVTGNQEVLFIDTSTGKTVKSAKLDVPLNDIKFWKR